MKFILLAFLIVYGLETILGSAVVIRNNTVYVDEKPVDLTKLEVLEDRPTLTRYILQSGNSNITITRSKIGNAISVATSSKLTPEEQAKLEEYNKKIAAKITNKVQKFQSEIEAQIKSVQDSIQQNMKSMFSAFPFF